MAAEKYITSTCSINNNRVCHNGEAVFASETTALDEFLTAIYQHLQPGYAKFYKMDNLSKLGWLATEVLLKSFDKNYYQPEQVGTVLANANSSLDMDLKYYDSIKDVPSPSLFVYTLPNIVAGEICIRNGFKGENAFFVQSKFDATFIKQQVDFLLDKNILQACICGWVDVLGQDYQAKLFLIEKVKKENAVEFSVENINV
ncbi:MAG: hypothetical protein V4592_13215 [Bacteroidota bacterium]